jgi:hypothetical protein
MNAPEQHNGPHQPAEQAHRIDTLIVLPRRQQ